MDTYLFHIINNISGQSPFWSNIFIFCATTLGTIAIILVSLFLIFHKDNREWFFSSASAFKARFFEGLTILVGSVFAWGVTKILKGIIARPRPFEILGDMHQLVTETRLESFPSGHATFFMALAIGVFLYHKKVGKLFLILVLIIGISRILVGVHYPSDVLAGWGVGILAVIFIRYIVLRIFRV